MRAFVPYFAAAVALLQATAATAPQICGTYPERVLQELHLSRQQTRARALSRVPEREAVRRDIGDIALIDTSGGVLGRRNPFDLERRMLRFVPVGSGYRVELGGPSAIPSAIGSSLDLSDDDSREAPLPFEFRFFDAVYRSVFVNSDGNLTFVEGDSSVSGRSLGRMVAGAPRIAALFRDLDPSKSGSVTVESTPAAFTVTWFRVPDYRDSGSGPEQTFQIRLYPDGRIEFLFDAVATDAAITGIGPGDPAAPTNVISFDIPPAEALTGTVAESFETNPSLDLVRVAQRFYETHGDAYDYLAIFNNQGLTADGAVAFQVPVRVTGRGYGLPKLDVGREFGSRSRLQSVLNMGPLSQYPADPRAPMPARAGTGDTPMTVLAHEAGHQYLSFVSVPEAGNAQARPMLGRQQAHWSFFFNSEASVMEGNRIEDRSEAVSPRFRTVATVEGYSALDRYLMGLGSADEVAPTFFVRPLTTFFRAEDAPRVGATFSGERVDVRVPDILAAAGRRTPDFTVAQARFRFAFILVTEEGGTPSSPDLEKLETLRRNFETYFLEATHGRASADAKLKEELRLTVFPAAGVVRGMDGLGAVELGSAAVVDLQVRLRADKGLLQIPEFVVIPAGRTRAEFRMAGASAGVETLIAEPDRAEYDTATARIQVAEASELRIEGSIQGAAIEARVTDINELPYPGLRVSATVSGSSVLEQTSAMTDDRGVARFAWRPGYGTVSVGVASVTKSISALPILASVLNAASLEDRVAPGTLVSAFGVALDGAQVRLLVGSEPVQILRRDAGRIDFVMPATARTGPANVIVETERGASPPLSITIRATAPEIFVDGATGLGAIVSGGVIRPFARGETVEVYTTGVTEAPSLRFAGIAAELLFAGLAPGIPGVWQLNAVIPNEIAGGEQQVVLISAGEESKPVRVRIAQ